MSKKRRRDVPDLQLPMGPQCRDLHPKHKRVIVLGGGEIGIKTLWALMTYGRFERFIHTVAVWPDWLNNSLGRYLAHYGDVVLPGLPEALVEFAQSLPRPNPGMPLQMTGRIVEQLRMFEYARKLGFAEDLIIKARYSDALLEELRVRLRLDGVIVAAFGGRIGQPVRQAFENRVAICHPGFAINDNLTHLPEECRGAHVFDRIVSQPCCQSLQIVMLDAEEQWDTGRIRARTHEFGGPQFFEHEMREEFLSMRARKAIEQVAVMYGPLVRYNLLRYFFPVSDLVGHFGTKKLLKMNFGLREIQAAQQRRKKRERQD